MLRTLVGLLIVTTTVRADEPLRGVTARATSAQVEKLFGAENLCSDTGLTAAGNGKFKLTTNGYVGGGCMWHSGYLPQGGDENAIVEFDLGRVVTVGRCHVWNHNGNPSRGFRQVAMLSGDDGKTWRAIGQRFTFAQAPRSDDYTGEDYEFTPPVRGRYLRFICEATHRQGGNRELAGLGKVRFYAAPADAVPAGDDGGDFPAGAGVIDVRQPPYHAVGDGRADDTAALQRAIDDWQGTHRLVYLPPGTYLVSKSLRYTPGKGHGYNNLRGTPGRSIIRLKAGTFTDAKKPQPVLSLGFNGRPDGTGVHADWFNNNVGGLVIDTGATNPGAISLQYYANNAGALRDVRLEGGGVVGLDLAYADQNGPCLIKNVAIDGFTTGVRSGFTVNSQTAERVVVTNATTGWENGGQCLAIRGLTVNNCQTGFVNKLGVVALIDSPISGSGPAAIVNGETLFVRNVTTSGFKLAIDNRRERDTPTPSLTGPDVDEWVSTPPLTLFPTEKPRSLKLPVRETPDVPRDDPKTWANVRAFRELSDPDDSAAIQRAIDSGATTIYFPAAAQFVCGSPVELRGNVRRVLGLFANVRGVKGPAVWRTGPNCPPIVVVEDLCGDVALGHAGPGTLVVKDMQGVGGTLTGGGDLFLENVTAEWDFTKGRAWARQFNTEREGTHITNAGATLWILGLKTERGGTLIDTKAGGSTEVLGGLSYTTTKGKLAPMFTSTDARVTYVLGEVCYSGEPYSRLVEQRRGGETRTLKRTESPLRPNYLHGGQLPLFVGQ